MITEYFKNLIADNLWHTHGDAASSLPAQYFVALSSTEPKADGSGVTEPSEWTDYARKPLASMSKAIDGATHNVSNIVWPKCNMNCGSVAYWALYDEAMDGHVLMGGALDSEKHLDAGTTIVFESSSLTLKIVAEE